MTMSATSDKYERDVAENINSIPGITAQRLTRGTDYPDVNIKYKNKESWLEVKMNHTDNLSNPRVFYLDGIWQTTYKTPTAKVAIDILNSSVQTKQFLKDIATFAGIPLNKLKLPTTKGGLNVEGAVPLETMKKYFNRNGVNRYIANKENMDLGKIVTQHYIKGKTVAAYYMQAGDDFYRISDADPFNLGLSIPLLEGTGDFKVRISTRSEFYEIQAEIKITEMPNSKYSVKPNTKKLNPFIK
jgi:hypothetical protein